MTGYGTTHFDRKCWHGHLVKGWIRWMKTHSKATRRRAKKRARREASFEIRLFLTGVNAGCTE